jgi:hypothetical protein
MTGTPDCCREHVTQRLLAGAAARAVHRGRCRAAERGPGGGSAGRAVCWIGRGKADLKACVRVPGARGRRQEIRTFATTTRALLELREWLEQQQVTVVGMEATGDYWKPVYYLLEDACRCSC